MPVSVSLVVHHSNLSSATPAYSLADVVLRGETSSYSKDTEQFTYTTITARDPTSEIQLPSNSPTSSMTNHSDENTDPTGEDGADRVFEIMDLEITTTNGKIQGSVKEERSLQYE